MSSQEATEIIQGKDESGLDKSGNSEKWLCSKYILKVEPVKFAGELHLGVKKEDNQGRQVFYPSNQERANTEMGKTGGVACLSEVKNSILNMLIWRQLLDIKQGHCIGGQR